MDIDELVDTLAASEAEPAGGPTTAEATDVISQKRERLAKAIASGQGRYLGRVLSLDQLDKLSDSEVERLYGRYQMHMGTAVCKTLGEAVLTMYSDIAAHYRPEIDPRGLAKDLSNNPLVELGMSTYSGSLYHRFGMLLAPIAAAMITIRHCRRGGIIRPDGGNTPSSGGDDADRKAD